MSQECFENFLPIDMKGIILENIRSISGDDCFTFQFAALCERVLTNTTLLMDTLEGKLRIQLTGW